MGHIQQSRALHRTDPRAWRELRGWRRVGHGSAKRIDLVGDRCRCEVGWLRPLPRRDSSRR
jgi:hypothetical protein